jgi:site-specific DNA-methyltransferase (adenine-specific)
MSDSVLLLGDCLELMKDIPDKSIDLVLTDPPYGTTACKWDSVIPFEPMWAELKRVRKDNAAICLFGSEPFSSSLRFSNRDEYRYCWTWKKQRAGGFPMANKRPLKNIELISVFSFKQSKYYPQGLVDCLIDQRRKSKLCAFVKSIKNHGGIQTKTNYPKMLLEGFKQDFKTVHPTQKPVALLEYLIKTYTLEGNTVLDFTMGSGSTGVACKNLGRKFIGIEKDENYFKIAEKRIEEAGNK